MKIQRLKGEADDLNRTMWQLCSDKNYEGIQERLTKGEWDPNRPLVLALQPGGFLLLTAAVSEGQLALAKLLIDLGADVNGHMRGEETPLMVACGSGKAEMADLLMRAGADVNVKDPVSDEGDPGETPLMAAAENGHRDIVEKLLQAGARIDATTRRGRSALSIVLDRENVDLSMVLFLLEAGCPVDGRDLHYPVLHRNLELVELLLDRKPDVSKRFDWPTYQGSPKKGDTPLFVAVAENALEHLVSCGLDAPTRRAERLAIIRHLNAAGADVNALRGDNSAWNPLMLAVAQDDEEIAKSLIAAGADPARDVVASRMVKIGGKWKRRKGPLSAIGLAEERPDKKRLECFFLAMSSITFQTPNKPDAPNPAMAPRFHLGHPWRRVGDPGRLGRHA
jgi:ankyrin repeat protein